MNVPPADAIRVPHPQMHAFVSAAAQKVGLPEDNAELLAKLLTANDLRGVFSHGTSQIATYARLMRDGQINNDPQISIVQETPTSLLVDGDGGLGYFPAYQGTLSAIEKAKQQGMAVMVSRNHGHFGAAGIYARLTLPHDLLTFVTSGHQLHLQPGQPLFSAAGGSPISFSAPASQEEAMLLDFGTMHDLYASDPYREAIARLAPGIVFRAIGLGAICQTWGGLLAGIPLEPSRATSRFSGANQGSLVITFQIEIFLPPEQFKREVDEYVRAVRSLQPLTGFDQSYLPGGPEAASEEAYRKDGIPVGPDHQQRLEELAKELAIRVPW